VKSLTLTDADGNTAGTYQFADEDISFTLTATVDPTGTAVEWSTSDAYVATVTANGLTAVVTIIDEGDATITVTAGGSTATYTISTRSILETAVGYWEFDDPNNLLKATIGEDLIRGGWDDAEAPISYVEGPAAGNGAASVPKYNFLKCIHGIAPNGVEGATRVNEYTIMFDVMEEDVSLYHAVIQSSVDDALNQVDEASFYLKSRGRIGTGVIGDSPDGTTESGKWYRVIFSAKAAVDGGFYNYYLNGELLKENPFSQINDGRTTLHPAGVIFFGDTRPGEPYNERGDGYDYNDGLYVAGIAIWDRALTAAEVAALGMFNVE
jgi:hypothetical protein